MLQFMKNKICYMRMMRYVSRTEKYLEIAKELNDGSISVLNEAVKSNKKANYYYEKLMEMEGLN